MIKALNAFSPIPGQSEIWSAQKGTLRCTALRLRDGSLCLYSPVSGLGDVAKASLATLGKVSYLLAPNHYHHKGLKEYAEAFPAAELACSEPALPRLEKQTGLSFKSLETFRPKLPKGCRIAEPEGLKTGETWLIAETASNRVWIVCDSFKGASGKVGSLVKTVEMLGTFPSYGIKDMKTYAAWVETETAAGAPSMIVPCHGSMVQSEDLAANVVALLRR